MMPAQVRPNRGDARVALWIFLSFLVFYIGLTRGRFSSTDEIEVYQATQSLWERGNLAIDSPEGTPGRDGKRYAVANSGIPVATLPLYGIGKAAETILRSLGGESWVRTFAGPDMVRVGGDRWGGETEIFFVNLFNCFATALLCALFYLFSLRVGAGPPWALLATALLGLTSYVAPYSAGFFQQAVEALLLLATFYCLFADRQNPDWRWRLMAGVAAALNLQMRFPSAISLPALVFYHVASVWMRRPRDRERPAAFKTMARELAPFAAAVAAGLLLHGLDQFVKFGTVMPTGRYRTMLYNTPLLVSLDGFFLSPGDSVFLFTPLLALVPWTLTRFARKYALETVFFFVALAGYLLLYGKNEVWSGLYCIGPRYLAPLVPFFMLPLGPWMEARGRRAWVAVAPLALAGLWVQAIQFLVDFWKVIVRENYVTFQPKTGFLFLPQSCQLAAHSRALLAWNDCVDTWLIMVWRTFGPGRFAELALPLLTLLAGCLWQLRRSFREPAAESVVRRIPLNRRTLAVCAIAIAAGIVAAYSNHFQNGFHFDDSHVVVNNSFVSSLVNIPRFFTDATTFSALPSNQSYRPIVSMTLAIDYALGQGLRPFWFQASTFAWFLVLTGLLGLLINRLLDTSRGTAGDARHACIAAIAAGVYGLHPANADTVNYVSARSDVLSTVGVAAGLALYIFLPRWRKWGIYLLPVAVAMLAKPIASVFAPLLAIYLLLFPEAGKGRRVANYIAAIAPAFLLCGAMSLLVWKMTPKTWVAGAADARQYLITQPYVALLYFKTFILPTGLSADYDLQPFTSADELRLWAGVAFAVILLAGAVAAAVWRRTRVIGFGLIWFVIALLPTSLSPLAEAMNDHRIFFPYMGLAIALAGACAMLAGPVLDHAPRFAMGAVAFLLCASGFTTYQRNLVWRDDEALWHDAVVKGPSNGRALMNYGNALMAKGRLTEALLVFQNARRLAPFYPIVYVNLGIDEAALGRQPMAGRDFQEALQLGPQIPDCLTYYAEWLVSQGRPAEAEPLVQKALELSPADLKAQGLLAKLKAAPPPAPSTPDAYLALSLAQYRAGRYMDSISAAEQCLRMSPNYAEAYNNIGAARNALGQYDLAAAACQQALRLKPGFELALNNLKWALQMETEARRQGKP